MLEPRDFLMVDVYKSLLARWSARAKELAGLPRIRKAGITAFAVLAVFTLAGVFAVPPILRRVLTGPVAASLHRPVTVGRISFNPYRLLLNVDQLRIGEREGSESFIAIGHLRVKAAWRSIIHLAPVLHQVEIDRPAIHLERIGNQEFNFSDLTAPGPPPKPGQPPSKPFKFAVSNIQVSDGEVRFDDKVLGRQHRVDHIRIGVPFIANLPSAIDVFVQPLLEMVVDGSPFRLTGKAKPFGVPMESDLDLRIHKLDLAPYLGYVPRKLPIKMPSGNFSCDLQLRFVNAPAGPSVRLAGEAALDKLDVRDEANAPLVGFNHFVTTLVDVEPLHNVVHLGKIRFDELNANLVRKADGTTNFTALAGGGAAPAAVPSAVSSPVAAASSSPAAQASPSPAAKASPVPVAQASASAAAVTPTPAPSAVAPSMVSAGPLPAAAATPSPSAPGGGTDVAVDSFELADTSVRLTDNSGPAPAILPLQGIHVGLTNFHTVGGGPAPFDVAANLGGGGAIAIKGALDLAKHQVTSDIALNDIDLPALQAFAQSVLAATISSGKLSVHANVETNFGGNVAVHAEPANVSLDNFKLTAPNGETPVQWNHFGVDVGQADSGARRVTVKEVRADGLHLQVKRGRGGELNLASLARTSAPSAPEAAPAQIAKPPVRSSRHHRSGRRKQTSAPRTESTSQPAAGASPGWQYGIASVALENAEVEVEDDTTPRPVKLGVAPLNLHVKDVSSDLAKPMGLDLDAIFNRKGSLKVSGTAAVTPLKAELRVATRRLDLAFADPYLAKNLNARIRSALLTMNGTVGLAKPHDDVEVRYRGDATLGNLRMIDRLTGDNFLQWSALSVNRIDAGVGAGEPKVHIGGIALADFYARVILDRNGRLNLSDITTNPQTAPKSLTREQAGVAPAAAAAPSPTPTAAIGTPSPAPTPPAAPGAAPSATGPASGAPAAKPVNGDIEVGRITLEGGHVNYTDNFIKPNYTANLTEIGGKVGAFGTRSTTPADVALQGKVNGSAPISITGSINPLAPMAYVNIGAKADGIELTNLTPYSTKYTGYPIVKGILDLDVHYLLDQNNLTANNHIFIDQFTFGDRVESKDATNLPVRLAVALLKNSKGQIDLNLPVSGSLSDPQFSIGGVIWQVFKNLIVKAATSPFSLIAAAFGGGGSQELSYIEFAPGYATLTPDSISRLTTITKALKDRPALRMGVAGRADPEFDRAGLREAKVEGLVREQAGVDAQAKLTQDQYDKYLKRVYKAGKFEKPKDFMGLNKSLPPAEMKKLLVTNMEVTDEDLKKLADARADAVREWMAKQIDPARLFESPPQLDAKGISDKGKTTRADLSLQ